MKYKFDKELFKTYNLLGKIMYLFSIITHIPVEWREIYLKKEK